MEVYVSLVEETTGFLERERYTKKRLFRDLNKWLKQAERMMYDRFEVVIVLTNNKKKGGEAK